MNYGRLPKASILLALLLIATSCGDDAADDASSAPIVPEGPPVIAEASVESARVDIGDRVRYRVEVRWTQGHLVDFPDVLAPFASAVLYDAGYWKDEPSRGGRSVRSMEVVFDPGLGPVLEIPAVTIRFREESAGADAPWEEVTTEGITVEVTSNTEGAPEFREPEDLFELPAPPAETESRSQLLVFTITGGALVLLAVAWFFMFRKKKERVLPPAPPHEVAQRELAYLESLGLLEAGRVQEYYYRLTAILRRYIELRFGIMAPEQTTEEFLAAMHRSDALPADQKAVLKEFLSSADLVKYARFEPPVAEAKGAWEIAERFVKVTIQHEVPSKEMANAV